MYDVVMYRIHPHPHRKYNPLCRLWPPSSTPPPLDDSYACVPQPTAGELFEATIPAEASGGSFPDLFRNSSNMRDESDETDVLQDMSTRAMGRPAWKKGDAAPMESPSASIRRATSVLVAAKKFTALQRSKTSSFGAPSVPQPGVSFIDGCAIDGDSTEGETKGEEDDDDDGDDVARVPSDRVKTQDHRITTIASQKKAPAWLKHCQFWLTKAVSSIPAYVKHYLLPCSYSSSSA